MGFGFKFFGKMDYLERMIAIGPEEKRESMYGRLNVDLNLIQTNFQPNTVTTAHYKWWNFVPLNLCDQFRRAVNFYFLVTLVLCFTIPDTPVNPLTWFYALLFVVLTTMVKQGYEDFKRSKRDRYENAKLVRVLGKNGLEEKKSGSVEVGDIVCLGNEERVPCDMVILSTTQEMGQVYIETANLDGETNLKTKESIDLTKNLITIEELLNLEGYLECENPNDDLHRFTANLHQGLPDEHRSVKCGVSMDNLLLTGTRIKKTGTIYGVCVFAGMETKIALNSKIKRHKFSAVEKSLNMKFYIYLAFMFLLMILSGGLLFGQGIEFNDNASEGQFHSYMFKSDKPQDQEKSVGNWFYYLIVFFLIYNYLIPISLYVSVEVQKHCSSLFFGWDIDMYHEPSDTPAKCNNSDITEDLGLVTHVFTDKTGTLTENNMDLKYYCYLGAIRRVENLATENWNSLLQVMLLCHSVHVDDNLVYVANSPDEEALVQSCKENNFILKTNDLSGKLVVEDASTVPKYRCFQRLQELPFDSERKCMSVIVQDMVTGKLLLLCKGAENVMKQKAKCPNDREVKAIFDSVEKFSNGGLRTLVYAFKVLAKKEYDNFVAAMLEAKGLMEGRDEALQEVYESIEKDLLIVGSTGIEDKLQEDVSSTIRALTEAHIIVWLLTGDKRETAITIAKAAGLIQCPNTLIDLTKTGPRELEARMENYSKKKKDDNRVLIIDGAAVAHIMKWEKLKKKLYSLSSSCRTVIASRLSPIQKSEIIRMMKAYEKDSITLAIGDGGNDVSMIQEAHIGIGIHGREGGAAVRAADLSFARFKYLKKALLVHGHWNYTRLCYLIQYSFYKNAVLFLCMFYYQFFNAFSASIVYDSYFLVAFNMIYTSLPVLAYGITEQVFPMQELLNHPELYQRNRGNVLMSWRRSGIIWICNAIYHGLIIFFGVYFIWNDSHMFGWDSFSFGFAITSTAMLVITFKIMADTKFWNYYFVFSALLSLILYVSVTLIYTEVQELTMFVSAKKDYSAMLISPDIWLLVPLLTLAAISPNVASIMVKDLQEKRSFKRNRLPSKRNRHLGNDCYRYHDLEYNSTAIKMRHELESITGKR